ncbi:MAG TPA: acetyl/propionyl/methylcrotonyl-CoA carboxylase subunit alpha [Stellaceae bacterium]|nr:acetyl/propionyl/methylcrotonyl-CoA carboxylase subunit alpha [Stellaceae bacterium]
MFSKLLIANRGEIACRIIRTARRLGIATVAVYSEADADAFHVEHADEAYPIGPAPARESYLRIDRIIEVAQRAGATAIHPGYGFLSENADFAQACARAGIVFVGPPASAIRAMGSKSAAKALMEKAGVPLVPGYHGDEQEGDFLTKAAQRVGFPVLIKASAGGGGKGMRVVESAPKFAAALASAKREASSSFGDDRVLIEKYLTRPRHIEMQVFADRQGNVIHLFERDCSIQRRHQKVIEEAPAPGMTPERRRAMGEAAIAAARAVGYVGAGTVEFIAEGEAFYFMEMNTRLQVEHPVTEMITGLDLVEWQLRIAAGESLPLGQDEITMHGHAVEARLYAENPQRNFLPATGRLDRLRPPPETAELRIDSGVREGDSVTMHYDPMIAKVIAWGEDRSAALNRLAHGLAAYRIAGPATNRDFLVRLLRHSAFSAGEIDTGFIERHRADLIPPVASAPAMVLAAASLALLLRDGDAAATCGVATGDPHSPWHRRDGWRLNGDTYRDLRWRDGQTERSVRVHYRREGYALEIDGTRVAAAAHQEAAGDLALTLDGVRTRVAVVRQGDEVTVIADDGTWRLYYIDPLAPRAAAALSAGRLTAPMPGKVAQVLIAAGGAVKRGQALMVLEAMKMEHTIAAPADGTVERVHFAPGDLVEEGAELIAFSAAAE